MKILYISLRGRGLGVADRLTREGHDVLVYIHDEDVLLSGDGLLHKVPSWRSSLADASLVICDEPGFGVRAQDLRGNGRPVLGCDVLADTVEFQLQKQMQLMEHLNLPYPETKFWFPDDRRNLPSLHAGFIRVQENGTGHVTHEVKAQRDWDWLLSTVSKDAMLVSQDAAEGVECNMVGLWNGRAFLEPAFVTFDYKQALTGNLGASADCAGLLMQEVASGSKLVDETLNRLTPFLLKSAYRGMVTVRCIVEEKELKILGIRIGFSHDATDALGAALYEDNIGDVLFDCAIGVNRRLNTTGDFITCVRLTVAPWPYSGPDRSQRGLPVSGLDSKTFPWINLCDVYALSGGFAFAAGSGVIAKVLAHGRSIKEACDRVYRTLGNVRIAGGQYRTDIGLGVAVKYDSLKDNGWVS